jgi:hypothetical protein
MNDLASKIEQWLGSPIVDMMIAFVALGLSILVIFLGFKYRNKKCLSYSIDGCTLIEDFTKQFDGLEISFNQVDIKNLTLTKIILWNSGNTTISSDDIVKYDPLRILSNEDVNIFDCQIIQVNEESNSFALRNLNQNVNIRLLDFDYFDSNQGCVIQVIHDGKSPYDIRVAGKMEGIKKFDFSKISINRTRLSLKYTLGSIITLMEPVIFGIPFALMISIAVLILLGIGGLSEIPIGTLVTFAIVTIALQITLVGSLFEKKHPEGLERF